MTVHELRASSYEIGADEQIVAGEGRGVTTNDDGSTAQVDDLLTVATVRTWVVVAMTLLTAARPVINEANVFPVADSDTGTNLCLTLGEGRDALDALDAASALGDGVGLEDALRALARGALLGARGNSGVILSEYLRGFALGVAGGSRPDGVAGAPVEAVVAGLLEASRCAYDAVGHPREGTMLTAATGAAQAAAAALRTTPDAGLHEVVDLARAGAQAALERSVHELDVLRSAQMLDAGAYGLVLILDALGLALAEATQPETEAQPAASEAAVSVAAGTITIMDSLAVTEPVVLSGVGRGAYPGAHLEPAQDQARDSHTALDGEFEVMFVVEHAAPRGEVEALGATLRERLLQVGDSVVVVGGADEGGSRDGSVTGTWQVHVHTDVPLEALRAAQGLAQRQVVVRCLPHQIAVRAGGAQPQHAVVACTASPGLVTDLARSGAVVVLRASAPIGGDDLRRGALETTAAQVLLLPADRDAVQHAVVLAGSDTGAAGTPPWLEVVESMSDLHVVAAVSAWASAPEPTTAETLARSARLEAVRAAVAAVRSATADGEDLPTLLNSVAALLDDVRSGRDAVLTVLAGDLVGDHVLSELEAEATRRCPGIEVVVLASGRPSTMLVMGVDEP